MHAKFAGNLPPGGAVEEKPARSRGLSSPLGGSLSPPSRSPAPRVSGISVSGIRGLGAWTCLVHTFGDAGTNLGRASSLDYPPLSEGLYLRRLGRLASRISGMSVSGIRASTCLEHLLDTPGTCLIQILGDAGTNLGRASSLDYPPLSECLCLRALGRLHPGFRG